MASKFKKLQQKRTGKFNNRGGIDYMVKLLNTKHSIKEVAQIFRIPESKVIKVMQVNKIPFSYDPYTGKRITPQEYYKLYAAKKKWKGLQNLISKIFKSRIRRPR